MPTGTYLLFQIFYSKELVYVGHSKRPLLTTMSSIFFKPPMTRAVDVLQVSKIRYAMFRNESDVLLYETYLLLLYKPKLNKNRKIKDRPALAFPEVMWEEVDASVLSSWQRWMLEQKEQEKKYSNVVIPLDQPNGRSNSEGKALP